MNKDDFCVEEMMEIHFPISWEDYDSNEVVNWEEIQDWFKRCIEEFPYKAFSEEEPIISQLLKLTRDRHIWFVKYFSQFSSLSKEKEEK